MCQQDNKSTVQQHYIIPNIQHVTNQQYKWVKHQ